MMVYFCFGGLMMFLGGFSFFIGLFLLGNNFSYVLDWEILTLSSCVFSFSMNFDYISMIFVSCVMLISSMVVFYSFSYMSGDMYMVRFLFLVVLFVLSMLLMIISSNMISILLGWDGLGLVSYCLVIYYQNNNTYRAGMLTILMNRLGDIAILLVISWMLNLGSWFYFSYLFVVDYWSMYICMLIILAAFTSSAQIPFSSWLPAAMAAPTPVSSLVHSSTLVTAGVYLLIRYDYFLSYYNCSLFLFLSLMTMFMSGLGANYEYDLKKIIALSTLSQLGLMMSCVFLSLPLVSFFHLITHAFFKSLLFLCAGLFIHVMGGYQDIRSMGVLISQLPFSSICFCVCSLSLCGFPYLSGFYSKDLIIELYSFYYGNMVFYVIYYMSIGLTVMYSFRLIYYMLFVPSSILVGVFEDFIMNLSMILMFFMSVMGGSFFFWVFFSYYDVIYMTFYMKILSIMMIILGMLLGLINVNFPYNCKTYNYFLSTMWFMYNFNTIYMLFSVMLFNNFYLLWDVGWGEFLMSRFMYYLFSFLSVILYKLHVNSLKMFMFSFLFLFMIVFF
uniref:NADH-ubiquinone oxidoreductase chain 5 n=1 Tax=Kokeshia sp. NKU02 TaxID=1124182 RepID=A0A0X7YE65_9HEMI|nr:NADH dehydrogenase subunit 5 [Kokeshia sp. NKU02]